jgi:hypothetical protein
MCRLRNLFRLLEFINVNFESGPKNSTEINHIGKYPNRKIKGNAALKVNFNPILESQTGTIHVP